MGWVVIGRQLAMSRQQLVYQGKTTRVDACPMEWNLTTSLHPE